MASWRRAAGSCPITCGGWGGGRRGGGVALQRPPELVVSLLGILGAGGAYVPLDPSYPAERLAFILADAQAGNAEPVLVSERSLSGSLPGGFVGRVVEVDGEAEAIGAESAAMPSSGAGSGNLAYLIYTSGSTGRPKGVAIEHRSALAMLAWARQVYGAEEWGSVLASASITFDLSVFELFLPLCSGGRVVLVDNALAVAEPGEAVGAGELSLINTVPSAMAELLRMGALPRSVRTVNLAGEPLKRVLAEAIPREAAGRRRCHRTR